MSYSNKNEKVLSLIALYIFKNSCPSTCVHILWILLWWAVGNAGFQWNSDRRLLLPRIFMQGLEEAAGSGAVSVLNFVSWPASVSYKTFHSNASTRWQRNYCLIRELRLDPWAQTIITRWHNRYPFTCETVCSRFWKISRGRGQPGNDTPMQSPSDPTPFNLPRSLPPFLVKYIQHDFANLCRRYPCTSLKLSCRTQ